MRARLAGTQFSILFAVSIVHLLNDSMQSVVFAIFPIIKESLTLSYTQIGLIGLALNLTASVLQPVIGLYSDKRPTPLLLPVGMAASLVGIVGLALSPSFWLILLSAVLIGVGSSVFHPESSRVAYLAAGNRRGLAQSIFQVGGNTGQALAPIMTALIFVPLGQIGILWFVFAAGLGIVLQSYTARWYGQQLELRPRSGTVRQPAAPDSDTGSGEAGPGAAAGREAEVPGAGGVNGSPDHSRRRRQVALAIAVLVLLMTSKMAYLSGITSFYPFYLIDHYGVSVERAQLFIFAFLLAGVIGTFFGGPIADYVGRRNMIWFSILGAMPFTFLLPYVNLFWSLVFCVLIGMTILSSGSVTIVYAQELVPGKIGAVSGLFFGLAFGVAGLSAAALGMLADWTSIALVTKLCAFLPLVGLLTLLLPADKKLEQWAEEAAAV